MICKFTCPNGHVLQGLETQLGQKCICPQCEVTFIVQTISPAAAAAPAKKPAQARPAASTTPATTHPFSAAPLVAPAQLPPSNPKPALPRATPLRASKPDAAPAEAAADGGIPDFSAQWRSEGFAFDGGHIGARESAAAETDHQMTDFTAPASADESTDFLASVSGGRAGRFDPSMLEGLGDVVALNDSDGELPSGADLASGGSHVPGVATRKFYHIRCPKKHLLEVPGEALNTDMDCPACGSRFHVRLDRTLEFRRKQEQELERHEAKQGQVWLSVAIAAGTLIVLAILAIIIMGNLGH